MKHIIKGAVPAGLAEWQTNDRMFQRGRATWNRVPMPIREEIREALLIDQGFICCYCEKEIADDQYHVEHILPGGIPAFKFLGTNYDNMLCSCLKDTAAGDPLHCSRAKKHWYDPALYISPLSPDCEEKFKFTYDGRIHPANAADLAAPATIGKLKLDIPKLDALRKAVIDPFLDETLTEEELAEFVAGYLVEKADNNGRYNPFYTTIRYLFST